MPIKLVLTAGLTLFLGYSVVQEAAPRIVRRVVATVVLVGIYFVWVPDHSTVIANWLGVGRGADLLLYLWILLSLAVGLNLHFKLRNQRREITALAREVALMTVRQPRLDGDPGSVGQSTPAPTLGSPEA